MINTQIVINTKERKLLITIELVKYHELSD